MSMEFPNMIYSYNLTPTHLHLSGQFQELIYSFLSCSKSQSMVSFTWSHISLSNATFALRVESEVGLYRLLYLLIVILACLLLVDSIESENVCIKCSLGFLAESAQQPLLLRNHAIKEQDAGEQAEVE